MALHQPPPPPPPPPPPDRPPPPLPEDDPGGVDAEEIADEKLFPIADVNFCGEYIAGAVPAYQEGR